MKGRLSLSQIGTMVGAVVVILFVSTYYESLKGALRVKEDQNK